MKTVFIMSSFLIVYSSFANAVVDTCEIQDPIYVKKIKWNLKTKKAKLTRSFGKSPEGKVALVRDHHMGSEHKKINIVFDNKYSIDKFVVFEGVKNWRVIQVNFKTIDGIRYVTEASTHDAKCW